jgi:hypothetical protein
MQKRRWIPCFNVLDSRADYPFTFGQGKKGVLLLCDFGKKRDILSGRSPSLLEWLEHVLVDHVAAGIVEPPALLFLFDIRHEREFHGNAGHVAEHLFEFLLLCVHEERVRDLCRAEFLALAAVHAGVRDVSEADEVEHEVRRDLAGSYIRRVLGGTVNAVADRTGRDARVALDTA